MKRVLGFGVSVVLAGLLLLVLFVVFQHNELVQLMTAHLEVHMQLAAFGIAIIAGGIVYLIMRFVRIARGAPKVDGSPRSEPDIFSSVVEETRLTLGDLRQEIELKPAPRSEIQLSIVIPAFNEQARLPRTVLETIRWCTGQNVDFELIIA